MKDKINSKEIKILKERLAILTVNGDTNSRLARKWEKEIKEIEKNKDDLENGI